jgi:hypothetical protein
MLAVGVALFGVASTASMATAHVNVNIAPPGPPAIVVPAPPRLVVVPNTPVFYAPEVEYNYFVYGHRHYVVRDGRWYVARTYRGPWTFVPAARVPVRWLACRSPITRSRPGTRRSSRVARATAAPTGTMVAATDTVKGKGKHRD